MASAVAGIEGSISEHVRLDRRPAERFVGLELRESALAFGGTWAKQYFGARAENALITGRVVGVAADGKTLVAEWDFPDEDKASQLPIPVARARLLAQLWSAAERAAAEPEAQVGKTVARVFDFGLESGKVYTGVVSSYLGIDDDIPLWRIRHTDGDEEDLDMHELARAYHKLEEHVVEQSKGRKRRREGQEKKKRRSLAHHGDIEPVGVGPVTYGQVLRALSSVDIPIQSSRTNVTRGAPPRGLVLGAVNIRSHGGMQTAQATREKPNLARLLTSFFRYQCGDRKFAYTTIQINANYEAALHVDKFNLGPSYIVGVGDWGPVASPKVKMKPQLAGQLWVQGRGPLDCREQWQAFDGNTPHCTLPFSGTRFTLIFFTHCSQSILRRQDRVFLSELGFSMPPPEITKAPHMRTAEERLEAGRVALHAFLLEESDGELETSGVDATQQQVPPPPPAAAAAAFSLQQSLEAFVLDGSGGRPSSRVAQLSCGIGGSAPELRRHYGRALRRAAETTEALEQQNKKQEVTPMFITGDHAGEAASVDASCLATSNAKLALEALANRAPFVPVIESWEAQAASKKDEQGGAKLLAKYAGLYLVDEDPYGLGTQTRALGKTSDAVYEADRERARLAAERGDPLVERRVIRGVEWCRFARRWTAVTQLSDPKAATDESVEKYPIDRALVRMIVASRENDKFDFYDGEACRATRQSTPSKRRRSSSSSSSSSSKPSDGDVLPGCAVAEIIRDDLKIVVVQQNPKKGRSATRYEQYKHAKTATEYLRLGGSKADLQFDMIRGHVALADGADWRHLPCVVEAVFVRQERKEKDDDAEAAAQAAEKAAAALLSRPLPDLEEDAVFLFEKKPAAKSETVAERKTALLANPPATVLAEAADLKAGCPASNKVLARPPASPENAAGRKAAGAASLLANQPAAPENAEMAGSSAVAERKTTRPSATVAEEKSSSAFVVTPRPAVAEAPPFKQKACSSSLFITPPAAAEAASERKTTRPPAATSEATAAAAAAADKSAAAAHMLANPLTDVAEKVAAAALLLPNPPPTIAPPPTVVPPPFAKKPAFVPPPTAEIIVIE